MSIDVNSLRVLATRTDRFTKGPPASNAMPAAPRHLRGDHRGVRVGVSSAASGRRAPRLVVTCRSSLCWWRW